MREMQLSLWWTTARFIPRSVMLQFWKGKKTIDTSQRCCKPGFSQALFTVRQAQKKLPVAFSLLLIAHRHGAKDQLEKLENVQKLKDNKDSSLPLGSERSSR